MQMKNCTIDTAYFPETVEEFLELQKKKGYVLNFISKIVEKILVKLKAEQRDFHGIKYYAIGKDWGGLEMGDYFITDTTPTEHILCHELGHGVQNANVGGWSMFFHFLGSAFRYWIRQIGHPKTKYDDWYYEGNATALGKKYVEILEAKNETADKN